MARRPTLAHVAVVVPEADRPAGAAAARALAAAGAAVVCAGHDGEALGALARELADAGARTAVFTTDAGVPEGPADPDALVEMVAELFPAPAPTL